MMIEWFLRIINWIVLSACYVISKEEEFGVESN